jgi:hypothetical protein
MVGCCCLRTGGTRCCRWEGYRVGRWADCTLGCCDSSGAMRRRVWDSSRSSVGVEALLKPRWTVPTMGLQRRSAQMHHKMRERVNTRIDVVSMEGRQYCNTRMGLERKTRRQGVRPVKNRMGRDYTDRALDTWFRLRLDVQRMELHNLLAVGALDQAECGSGRLALLRPSLQTSL